MKTTQKIGIGLLVLTAILSIAIFALPMRFTSFQGTTEINGANTQTNVIVRACIGTEERGNNLTFASSGKTWYVMDAVGTGIDRGKNVTFRVDGLLANEIGVFNDLPEYVWQNLTVNQSAYTLELVQGWNLISIPVELKYDGCVYIVQ